MVHLHRLRLPCRLMRDQTKPISWHRYGTMDTMSNKQVRLKYETRTTDEWCGGRTDDNRNIIFLICIYVYVNTKSITLRADIEPVLVGASYPSWARPFHPHRLVCHHHKGRHMAKPFLFQKYEQRQQCEGFDMYNTSKATTSKPKGLLPECMLLLGL